MKHTTIYNSRFIGHLNTGERIYRERRGVNHIQDPARPNLASYTGTIKEIERASHSTFSRTR